jgi:DNA-binding NarL/FixJ family response regulator
MPQRQRVLIADGSQYFDHTIWRLLLPESEFEIIGVAGNTEEALSMAFLLSPDIILTDLSHSAMPGLQTIEALRTAHPNIPIITFSPLSSLEYTRAALDAGAAACLTKADMAEALLQTVQSLLPTVQLPVRTAGLNYNYL